MQFPSLSTIAPNALRATALALTLTLLGCADDDDENGSIDSGPNTGDGGPTADGGPRSDAATTDAGTTDGGPRTDAGATDAGPRADGGADAGGIDGGAADAGTDAGTIDAGTADAGAAIPTFNGCTAANYTDLSGASADRAITIAPGGEFVYAPKCIIIAAGQAVSWNGSLTAHPLAPGNAANAAAGSPNSPIQSTTTGTTVQFTFPTAGTYPYYCTVHSSGAGNGMAGVVHVR